MRVIIVGAGIMGCSTAYSLAARGAEVVLVERAVPGAEASSAAAGILGAQIEGGHGATTGIDRLVRARDGYAAWTHALRERTGIDAGYKRCGVLDAAFDQATAARVAEAVSAQTRAGLRAELLDTRRAREVEPALAESALSAAYFPDDAQVEPPALLRALIAALARDPRVTIRSGATVRGLTVEGDRCAGVTLDDGPLAADATVLAAGSWSSLVAGLPAALPAVRPARGQLVQLEERPPSARAIVFGAGGYVVPRGDGRVVCGSTMEFVGFRREVTAGGLLSVLRAATTLVPALAEAQVGPAWSSFRPHAETPLVGASPLPGLFLATGHHRNGILLAHQTGEEVAAAVLGA